MKLITDLRSTDSRIDKQFILKGASNMDRKVFRYAYSPYLHFGIANVTAGDNLGEPNDKLFELLDKLADGSLRGNDARNSVAEHARLFGDLIYLICSKDLNCGVSVKTINKVFPKTIPTFKLHLAEEVPLEYLAYPQIAQIKYDGVRIVAICDFKRDIFRLFTRNEKYVPCLQMEKLLRDNIKSDTILDGELTYSQGKMVGRTSISGLVNSAIHGTDLPLGSVDSDDKVVFNVFDCLKYYHFSKESCPDIYSHRFEQASKYVEKLSSEHVKLADSKTVNSYQEACDYYSEVLEDGYEGLILKREESLYLFKRSKTWVKVKGTSTADLECISTTQGKAGTKYEGCIGSLNCVGVVEGKTVRVSVGSGLTDADRNKSGSFFVGKTIEVVYNSVLPSSNKENYTLFLPRFVCVRYDK